MQQAKGGLAPFSKKGGPAPFFLSISTPRLRDDALLTHALEAYQAGRHADALIAAEYVCRRYPFQMPPALLRAQIVQACRPELTADAWEHAWRRAPEHPGLQDALLNVWHNTGHTEKIRALGPAFLPARCRSGQHAGLIAHLRQAGLSWLGACWKADDAMEGMVFAPAGGPPTVKLLLSDETMQYQLEVPTNGRRFRMPCPRPNAVWSLAIAPQDGGAPQLLPGSPLAFYPAPRATAKASERTKDPQQARPVSIVIPVYRDTALVQACINSVLASLPLNRVPAQIVVIDDASPEPELSAWLDQLARQGAITLLRNLRNLGFIETVNRGMRAQPEHDVLMLNADTQVHGDWIDRLAAALYQAPDIASVTCWTNNGEMSSFPKLTSATVAPTPEELAAIDKAAAALRASGQTTDVELPTCCGFTMLMRRRVLDDIGMLDGSALERGYNEETDWCLRARSAGWRHMHATGVYVAHTGSVSFKLEKYLRVHQNNKVLDVRYPTHHSEYANFLRSDPLRTTRNALKNAIPAMAEALEQSANAQTDKPAPVPAPLPGGALRALVWQHRHSAEAGAALLALARHIASTGHPMRLLVIGEVSDSLWRTGVVDGMPPGIGNFKLLLGDKDLALMSACCAVLADAETDAPAELPLTILNQQFDPAAWLAGITQPNTLQ